MIRQAIVDGTFEAGAPLVEGALAEFCQVSRTPIREALTRLEQDGLVLRGPRGLVVRERSPEEILDIYVVRIALEATASQLAAERFTQMDRLRLEKALDACDQADVSDPSDLALKNNQFHRAIWHASHNESLIDLLERLNTHLSRYPETTLAYPGRWEEAIGQHRMIVDAIVARDGQLAHSLTEIHFRRARQIRLQLWGEQLMT